jgi:aspartate/tyrosine/aromatic aminotransferase
MPTTDMSQAPADAIYQVLDAWRNDPLPSEEKLNLSVGAYRTEVSTAISSAIAVLRVACLPS